MNRLLYSITIIISFIIINQKLYSQEIIKLTLQQSLQMAKESNLENKLANAEVDAMKADYNKSLAAFLPQVTLSETFIRTDDPLNSFGFKLKNRSVTQMDFNPVLLNNPDEMNNYVTSIDVIQPLINLDAFLGRAAAADGLSAINYKRERTKNYINFLVKVNYFKVKVMQASLSVVEEAVKTAEANLKLFNDYHREGLITKADLLKGEVFLSNAKSKKVEVEGQLKNAIDEFKVMIGLDDETNIELIDSLDLPSEIGNSLHYESLILNRSDIKAYEYKANSFKHQVTMSWMKFVPRFNVFGKYEFNDDKVFGTNSKSWMVGLNLQWNIFNGYRNIANIQKSKANLRLAENEYTKAKLNGINEIKAAEREINTSKMQFDLTSKSVEQYKESLRIIKDRYKQGLEKTTDLLIAETDYSAARLNYLQSLFMYNMSIYKMQLMTEIKK